MKIRKFALFLAIALILPSIALSACGSDNDIVTEVRFTCYDNGDGDMVSFYMTSDIKPLGIWEYTIENQELFEIFMDSEQTEDYGLFGWGGSASYRTLILKPVKDGEGEIDFKLTNGISNYSFSLTVKKDSETEKYKIEVKEKK